MQAIMVPIHQIDRDGSLARTSCNPETLQGLTESVQEVGLLHPLVVQRKADGRYRLVAGERRLRAAEAVGKREVAVLVLSQDASARQVQLVENLQREDLDPLERALAVQAFMQERGLSKLAASKRLGVARTTLTDWLDLLTIEARFQRAIIDNHRGGDSPLTLSHASEALALGQRMQSPGLVTVLLDAVLQYKLTKGETRQVAALVRGNANVSIETAIRVVRPCPADENEQEADPAEYRMPHEANLADLATALERSARVLGRMQHMSGRFLPDEERRGLQEQFVHLRHLADQAIQRLDEARSPGRTGARGSRRQPAGKTGRRAS